MTKHPYFLNERPEKAKKRLRFLVGTLYGVVLLLIGAFLYNAQREIQDEMFFKYRTEAESVVARVEEHLGELLAPEERRAFDEYNFYSVSANTLFDNNSFRLSPLAELPPKSLFPALVGYFQINPDGTFQSPVLPNIDRSLLSAQTLKMRPEEFVQRLGVFDTVARTVSTQRLVPLPSVDGLAKYEQSTRDKGKVAALESGAPATAGKKDSSLFDRAEEAAKGAPARGDIADQEPFQYAEAIPQEKQLRELNLDDSLYQRQQSIASKLNRDNFAGSASKSLNLYPAPRKEQSWAPQLQSESDVAMLAPEQLDESKRRITGEMNELIAAKTGEREKYKITVTSFEAEVDPIQFIPLSDGRFVFYRKVWKERTRYIQGFVVDKSEFLSNVIEQPLRRSVLASAATLLVAYNGQVMSRFDQPSHRANGQEIVIFRSALAAPLSTLELVFTVGDIPLGPSAQLLFTLAVIMILVLTLGLVFIYRLGAAHIELSAKKTDFVSAVSHELKTPLTSIRMYAEILRAGWTTSSEQVQQYYDFIYSESERLSRLISNVLQLSKLATNRVQLDLKIFSPEQLLNLTISKTDTMIRAAGFELQIERAGEVSEQVTVQADEDAFVQILLNLIDNALKFSKNALDKRIICGYRLKTSGEKCSVSFYVRDFGPGIPDTQKRQIFTLFYRAESELTRATPGTGIGLALVRELAEQMNASVDLVNRNPGAEFELTFSCLNYPLMPY